MTIDAVFALPRKKYDSYNDLYRLLVLAKANKCTFDQMRLDDASACYIVPIALGDDWSDGWKNARARIIQWVFEWDVGRLPYVSECWCPDSWRAKQIGARYVPVGGHHRLGTEPSGRIVYDIALLAYMTGRRNHAREALEARGVRVSPTSAWAKARAEILTTSRTYLHIHQSDDHRTLPPLRLIVAAAYHLPFVTEAPREAGMFRNVIIPYDNISHARFDKPYTEQAEALHQLLCHDYTFERSVQGAL